MMKSGADLRPLTQQNETRPVLHTSGWFRQGREPERQVPLWVTHAKRLRLANRLTNTKSQWLFDLVLVEPKEPRPTTNTHTRSGYLPRLPHVRASVWSKTIRTSFICKEKAYISTTLSSFKIVPFRRYTLPPALLQLLESTLEIIFKLTP